MLTVCFLIQQGDQPDKHTEKPKRNKEQKRKGKEAKGVWPQVQKSGRGVNRDGRQMPRNKARWLNGKCQETSDGIAWDMDIRLEYD